MKAQLKCSNCGAEISNLNMGWGKKQWFGFIPLMLFIIAIPFFVPFMSKDRNDFRTDLSVKNIEKSYGNGTMEFIGIIENKGDVTWENIEVEVELFSKEGKFLDELKRLVSSNLSPATSEYFKISTKEFPESRWKEIGDLKAKVADAYHSKY